MLEMKDRKFYLDGKPFHIYSGAMHYFRIPEEYWLDRLLKLKASGLNTVETYVPWNWHEPKKGQFNFDGMLNIERFIKTAQEVGLYVIVRPGPYICAEWDFGGLPAWLLKDKNIRLRCWDKAYISAVESFFKELLPKLVPYQLTKGGSIIAMQVENEYGSFGRDKKYLYWLRDLMRKEGIDVQLFTSDGEDRYFFSGGGIKEDWMVANFGGYHEHRFDDLKMLQPDKPLMCGEHWCGWFDRWGAKHHSDNPEETLGRSLDGFFKEDANFNLYMFHGGTNFGFSSGANYYDTYCPTTTSYDYGAPLTENGAYTEKYFILRDRMKKQLGCELPELPEDAKTKSYGKVQLTEFADLRKVYKKFADHKKSHIPYSMEHYGQNSGLILYSTTIKGNYGDTEINGFGVHDIAYIYINGELKHVYDRTKLKGKALYEESFSVPVKVFDGEIKVDILVQALGRINYARRMYDRKGLDEIYIGGQAIVDWDVYCMELDKAPSIKYGKKPTEYPCFMKGTFKADEKVDTFVDMRGFSNAVVYINGFNLGRFLKRGPQFTLYLPAPFLKEENEIVVLELEGCKKPEIKLIDKPILK
ncbi:MAG: beta-galactosidase [Clostridia bacterium]|nr:beta-galactosidase [Clostridia bacterium]